MRILIVAQYFWPENFRINDIALGLSKKGHEVTVFTGKPNYTGGNFYPGYSMFSKRVEVWNHIKIHRVPLISRGKGKGIRLVLNYLSFVFFGCIRAVFLPLKPDVILIYQQSPITVAIPAYIFKYKTQAKSFLYVQDLWPESVQATMKIKSKLVVNLLYSLCNWIYRSADKIIIQSKAFRSYLISRNVSDKKIVYLPNSTESLYQIKERSDGFKKYFNGEVNLIFAGNIGEAQSFETLIKAAKIVLLKDKGISWVILGEGRKRAELIELVKKEGLEDHFRFLGFYESTLMPEFFAYADAFVISLKSDFIFSLTIPTKLQSYMACGKPILGSLNGEGNYIIQGVDCGFVSPAEDSELLAENVLKLRVTSKNELKRLGMNGYKYFTEEFEQNMLLNKLEQIILN